MLAAAAFLLNWRLNEMREPAMVTEVPPETPKVIAKEVAPPVVDQTPPPPPPPPVVMNEPPKPMKPAPVIKEEELKFNRFYKTVSTRLVKAHVGDPARLTKEVKAAHELRASPNSPLAVPSGDSGLRAKIRRTVDEYWASLDPDRCVPHPDAEKFPGPVLEPADRVITAVNLPINRSRWHSTGTYAAPGERITFRISSGDADLGLVARIGCHNDDIVGATKRESWHRFPVICNSVALNKRTVELANPFGGPIFIDIPGGEKNAKSRDQIRVEIVGAVEAPIFIHGKTTRAEWENRRLAPPLGPRW